jgi:hypothetical protein
MTSEREAAMMRWTVENPETNEFWGMYSSNEVAIRQCAQANKVDDLVGLFVVLAFQQVTDSAPIAAGGDDEPDGGWNSPMYDPKDVAFKPAREPAEALADRICAVERSTPLGEDNVKFAAIITADRAASDARIAELEEKLSDQTNRRVYYQNIVYAVCNTLDRINKAHSIKCDLSKVVCGTLNSPSTEVQSLMAVVAKRMDEDCAANAHAISEQEKIIATQAAEIERLRKYVDGQDLRSDFKTATDMRAALESKLAEAGKGIDPDLLETARHAMAGLLAESGRGNAAHNNKVASDAVAYARALHAALRAGAGREGA